MARSLWVILSSWAHKGEVGGILEAKEVTARVALW